MTTVNFDPTLPVLLRSADGDVHVRANRPFVEHFGLNNADLEARPLLDWIHPEDRNALEGTVTRGTGCVEARHRAADGEWYAMRWTVRPSAQGTMLLGIVENGEGEPCFPLSAPLPLKASMAETMEAMVHVVEAKNPGMRCSILLVDSERRYVTVGAGPSFPSAYNAAVEGLNIGPTVGSCGTAAFWNIPVIVEDIGKDPLWKDLREAASIAGVRACWSHPINSMSGEVLGAMALYCDEPKAPTPNQIDGLEIAARMVGLAIERARLEEQLQQTAKVEALGVLAGGIAHDFNNILATIMGNAELAMASAKEASEAEAMLQDIVTASLSATELCDQMLAYAGRGSLSTEPVDINALVRDLSGFLQVILSKKADLELRLSSDVLGVIADRGQLRQVMMNLIRNASDAIGDNPGKILVASAVRHFGEHELMSLAPSAQLDPGPFVVLTISDTGCGIPAAVQARIFDPFFTTKPNGRGLGLAAVQGIVSHHGGAITVESDPGRGTDFRVLFPYVPLGDGEGGATEDGEVGDRARHVLVVDDEPRVRNILSAILQHGGYRVTTASDGVDGLEKFRETPDEFDCVLLDLSMPKLNGEEVFHELRKVRPDVRVVLSSGFAEQEILDRFEGAGLAGVVHKPAKMETLLATVGDALVR